jgi:ketosteroid isomerase-like protein
MPERSAVLHRRLYQAFNAHDVDGLIALCDPSVVIQSVFGAVTGAIYRGHDGVRRWQRELEDAWGEEIRVEAEAYFDLGENALAFDVLHGRGRKSGAEVALPGAAVTRWRAGRCIYFNAYADRTEALEELGVTEDSLEPISFGN